MPPTEENGQSYDCSASATMILRDMHCRDIQISLCRIRVPTPDCGCAATQSLYEPVFGIKSLNPELHKVTLRFATLLPERPYRGRFACPAWNANTAASHENNISRTFSTHSENTRTIIVTYVHDSTYKCYSYYADRLKVLL